jgi:GMP synthase-like glutamine amidotransferase
MVGVELVLSLGSDWSVYWDHAGAAVAAETSLMLQAHRCGIPVLGICFGAQLLAVTHGGSVSAAPEPELGWYEVASSVPALAGRGPWFQWHADRFVVPPTAQLLASTERAPQAFVLGRTLAVQFHPEVTEAIVRRWCDSGRDDLARCGRDAEQLLEQTAAQTGRSGLDAASLVDWFCEQVAGA